MKKYFILLAIVSSIVACTAAMHLQPSDSDLVRAQQQIPGITLYELQAGYKLFMNKCSGCHRLHNPREYTSDKWRGILSEMFVKAKLTDGKSKQLIENYLLVKSR